ncbi:hypothetical protein [Chryseobacterium gossypii]|uniref:hypothetical protein n=1 Tax=Chryseobacterium gossypii TaxID=3231602 RepID=UPI0035249AEB
MKYEPKTLNKWAIWINLIYCLSLITVAFSVFVFDFEDTVFEVLVYIFSYGMLFLSFMNWGIFIRGMIHKTVLRYFVLFFALLYSLVILGSWYLFKDFCVVC